MVMRGLRCVAVGLVGALITVVSVVAVGSGLDTGAGASSPRNTIPPAPYMSFGDVPLGASAGPGNTGLMNGFDIANDQTVTIDLSTDVTQSGRGAGDYTLVPSTNCPGAGTGTITLGFGVLCLMNVYFTPGALGDRSATMRINMSDGTYDTVGLSGTGTASLSFGDTTLGAYSGPDTFALFNTGSSTDTIDLATGMSISGPGADDYVVTPSSDCAVDGVNVVILAPRSACTMNASFYPGALGDSSATVTIQGSVGTRWSVNLSGAGTIGYYQVDSSGNVAYAGDAGYFGDAGDTHLNKPIVGMAATGDDGGYWLVASDGGIFNYGDANFYGSTGGIHLNKPIVGMAGTLDAGGYWLVATDGGIFAYGDAQFYGSTGSIHLNKPIVGMAPTPDGAGYWLVASDGGIFSYGDAQFYGSTGSIHLNKPIVGMAPTPDGAGYWLVASDGGIFSYGNAQFYGSTGAIHLAQPIVAMAAMPTGGGYWFSAADGGLFNYGDAPFLGSGVGTGLGAVVDMASDGGPTLQAFADISAVRQGHVSGLGPAGRHVPHFAGP
jgi:hypothetical protein